MFSVLLRRAGSSASVGAAFTSPSKQAASCYSFQRLLAASFSTSSSPPGNVPPNVWNKVGRNLHLQPCHPLNIIKTKIEGYFNSLTDSSGQRIFKVYDSLDPKVNVRNNFDDLLVPADHVSRKATDTFYLDANTVLRTHTSAHQTQMMKSGNESFLVVGDVYRRDSVDASHYPVFHQMEGVKLWKISDLQKQGIITSTASPAENDRLALEAVPFVKDHLKNTIQGLAHELFGQVEMRWIDCYFPFTEPSLELEVFFRGQWLEVLGCGVIHRGVLKNSGREDTTGWALGLGLERLAMILFDIPDIRLFWSEDPRFLKQFESGKIVKFQPYSKFPACYKDISFWVSDTFHENDLHEAVRSIAGDLVEEVKLVDSFVHPKTKRTSHCYRINYRSMDRSLTNEEIDKLQFELRDTLTSKMNIQLR